MSDTYDELEDSYEDSSDEESSDEGSSDEESSDENYDDGEFDDDYEDINTIEVPTARNVLEYLVKSVVEHPEEVEIEILERRGTVTLEVSVAEGDMGRVIGRRGRVANSIRTIVRAAASKDDSTIDVEFVD